MDSPGLDLNFEFIWFSWISEFFRWFFILSLYSFFYIFFLSIVSFYFVKDGGGGIWEYWWLLKKENH